VTPLDANADALYRGFPDFSAWGPLSPEDADLWSRFAASLEERRRAASPEVLQQAVDVAVRAAALDTGAIEGLYEVDRGFTMTVAVQGLAWEQMIGERGAGVRELFEAQLAAYELVLDAVTRHEPITEVWIRSLHEALCAPQTMYRVLTAQGWQEHELPKGEYKKQPNHVLLKDGTVHAYAPVDLVSSEMYRLLQQTRSPAFEAAHPVLQASYVHYAFVVIHPFADGNGRVARALASVFFYRACSIPFLVFANQKPAYLDALHSADLDDKRPLLAFFRDRGIDTMQLVTEGLLTAAARKPEEIAARIRAHTPANDALSSKEINDLGFRLLDQVKEEFARRVLEVDPDNLVLSQQLTTLGEPAPTGYRTLGSGDSLWAALKSKNHFNLDASVLFRVLAAADPTNSFAFRFEALGNADHLDVRLTDVYPELTTSFNLRLREWAQRQLSSMLADLERRLHSQI
jgi:Fic family protein